MNRTGHEPGAAAWQPGLRLSTQNFKTMYAIEVGDELTHQVLLLTPGELAHLRELLASVDDETLDDPARNREGARLKALALYNGHSLPSVDRERYEAENTLTAKFRFEVVQVVDGERRPVGEL